MKNGSILSNPVDVRKEINVGPEKKSFRLCGTIGPNKTFRFHGLFRSHGPL